MWLSEWFCERREQEWDVLNLNVDRLCIAHDKSWSERTWGSDLFVIWLQMWKKKKEVWTPLVYVVFVYFCIVCTDVFQHTVINGRYVNTHRGALVFISLLNLKQTSSDLINISRDAFQRWSIPITLRFVSKRGGSFQISKARVQERLIRETACTRENWHNLYVGVFMCEFIALFLVHVWRRQQCETLMICMGLCLKRVCN